MKPFMEAAESKITFPLLQLMYLSQESDWIPYYNFMVIQVPDEILNKDPFLVALRKVRKFRAGILRTDANTCYNWHVDTDRHAAVNMLVLDDETSKCIFAPVGFDLVMPIVELKYKPSTYFAFNTQLPHTVINFSEPRYLFSLEFIDEDRGLTYNELCADIQGLNYGN